MAEFKITFSGRERGGVGKLARIVAQRQAPDRSGAVLKLFEVYQGIRIIAVEEVPDGHRQHQGGH